MPAVLATLRARLGGLVERPATQRLITALIVPTALRVEVAELRTLLLEGRKP